MLPSTKPVVAACAVRTASGKSQTSRRVRRILLSILWTTGLLVVFAPLAVRKYRSIDR